MNNYLNWQNSISTDHKIVPLLFVADYRISPVDKIVKDDEDSVKLCNYMDVYKNTYITSDIEFMEGSASKNEIERFLIEDGDVLITKDSESWNDIGIPAIVKGNFENTTVCGYHLALMRPYKKLVIPKYLFYCFESKQHRLQLEIEATGVTRFGIPKNAIAKYKIPLPSIAQQNKIVNYLDAEVAKIDALIEKKTQLISILEEKKEAVINQAVTKGLNPNVSMKDSEIEWLGEIPEHWEMVKLKYLTDGLKYGANEAAEDDNYNDPRYIRITDIDENGDLREETFRSIPFEVAEEYLLQDGDILLARSGATVGKSFLYKKEYGVSAYAGYLIRMRCNAKISPRYMYYYTLSSCYWDQIYIDSIQATIQNFSGEKYANMIIVIPNYEEQEKIIDSLDLYIEKFNDLKKKALLSLDLLKEKRTAIISAAVNGELNASIS